MSDPIENKSCSEIWNDALLKFLEEAQKWIQEKWNLNGSSPKTRLICRQLISSLEIIPSKHTIKLLEWIRDSIATRKDFILSSIHESLLKQDQINHGKRPWLVYQFKALL